MHLSGIELRRVARFPGGFFGTGDEIGVGDSLAAEVCLFEVTLDPFRVASVRPDLIRYSLISVYHIWLNAF